MYTLFQDPLFRWLGIRGEGLAYAKDYMDILMWAVFDWDGAVYEPNVHQYFAGGEQLFISPLWR
ncbi:hypothetical protein D3C72_2373420 [compost metagenome]